MELMEGVRIELMEGAGMSPSQADGGCQNATESRTGDGGFQNGSNRLMEGARMKPYHLDGPTFLNASRSTMLPNPFRIRYKQISQNMLDFQKIPKFWEGINIKGG